MQVSVHPRVQRGDMSCTAVDRSRPTAPVPVYIPGVSKLSISCETRRVRGFAVENNSRPHGPTLPHQIHFVLSSISSGSQAWTSIAKAPPSQRGAEATNVSSEAEYRPHNNNNNNRSCTQQPPSTRWRRRTARRWLPYTTRPVGLSGHIIKTGTLVPPSRNGTESKSTPRAAW
ncbi:unnamed protein product [Ectocarpus sp. 8 AP-2014]